MRRTLLAVTATAVATILAACGGSDDGASGCTPSSTVKVGAEDNLRFDAESYEAAPPCVEFIYENNGSVAHTLLIRGKPGFKLAVGDTDKGSIDLPAGTYELFCDVAGHEAAGMTADLTVA